MLGADGSRQAVDSLALFQEHVEVADRHSASSLVVVDDGQVLRLQEHPFVGNEEHLFEYLGWYSFKFILDEPEILRHFNVSGHARTTLLPGVLFEGTRSKLLRHEDDDDHFTLVQLDEEPCEQRTNDRLAVTCRYLQDEVLLFWNRRGQEIAGFSLPVVSRYFGVVEVLLKSSRYNLVFWQVFFFIDDI